MCLCVCVCVRFDVTLCVRVKIINNKSQNFCELLFNGRMNMYNLVSSR